MKIVQLDDAPWCAGLNIAAARFITRPTARARPDAGQIFKFR